MKKQLIIILVVLMMLFACVGCSNNAPAQPADAPQSAASEGNDKDDETTADEQPDEQKIDTNLSGLELLKSIEYKIPDSLIMETETVMADGSKSTTKTYQKGEFSRMESSSSYGDSVIIYNPDEGNTYQFNIGQAEGVVIPDGEETMMDMGEDEDMSAPDLSDFIDSTSEGVEARIETLDGHEVIYVESMTDDEDGSYNTKMWFSTEYSVPLKYEIEMNGQIIVAYTVTNIQFNVSVDDSLFVPPADVNFTDLSLDNMFGDIDLEDME